jgi:hypothetical protein
MTSMLSLVAVFGAATLAAPIQNHHQAHAADRARHGMGFDQQRTTHHFLIEPDGGTIQVTAKDAGDTESESQIRTHLQHIAQAFAAGDFTLPLFIHETEPPGTAMMKERHSMLTFTFERTPAGGKVIVRTSDRQALTALHDFLRFQIREHKTGDPLTAAERKK